MQRSQLKKLFYRLNPVFVAAKRYYHLWYYNSRVWEQTSWMGVQTYKFPTDMWSYQEILVSLQPSLIIEFGTWHGGSALFFASVMRQIGRPFLVVTVDIADSGISEKTKSDPNIRVLTMSSASEEARHAIKSLRRDYPGPAFAILDSDHSKDHVLAEMMNLRNVLVAGDYMVVEDSNINGHPVFRKFGPGPYEAIQEYFRRFPNDYEHDLAREQKFGVTAAPLGFLRRR
jgi:cephalosporin hydroxylase